jgi:hypothetical protein
MRRLLIAMATALPALALPAPGVAAVRHAVAFARSPRLDALPATPGLRFRPPAIRHRPHPAAAAGRVDPRLQRAAARIRAASPPVRSFDGMASPVSLPPDPNIAVGDAQIVEMVNDGFAVFDRAGNLQTGPTPLHRLWAPLGFPCGVRDDGDPIVIFDRLAHRFLLSQFAAPDGERGVSGSFECIAISTTPDALGPYALYAFRLSRHDFEDYPKLATWLDSYYLTTVRFRDDDYVGPDVFAFDRAKLLAGDPTAAMIERDAAGTTREVLLPADVDGATPPAPGEPVYLVGEQDAAGGTHADAVARRSDRLVVDRLVVDWARPGAAALTGPLYVPVPPFDSDLCAASSYRCIRQPGTGRRLDALSDRLMWRLAWRRFADHDALVANHTVDVDGRDHAGIRWYELRPDGGGSLAVAQAGTYAPDGRGRFMGSIAMDRFGDIAVGYSVSGTGLAPSIAAAGRLAADPPNELAQGELPILTGGGSQTNALRSGYRWGDYSALQVDPADDCTFWYVNEYLPGDDAGARTRIAAFRFPDCASPPGPDVTPPSVPFVAANHVAHAWSRSPTIVLHWSAAADESSGIAGYSWLVDGSPHTVPAPVANAAADVAAAVAPVPNGTWYGHVRVVDAAGNWSPSVDVGPFHVDTRCTIGGTDGADTIEGTARADVICALDGDDVVDGAGGNDTILGGAGADSLFGGGGRDHILGGPGPDALHGSDDRLRDLLDGGSGADVAYANPRRVDLLRSIERRRFPPP